MKVGFKNESLKRLFVTPPDQVKGKQKYPREVIKQYQTKVQILTLVDNLMELNKFRSLNFEALIGNRKGQYSIRLNKQYRLLFREVTSRFVEIEIIEIPKHYE